MAGFALARYRLTDTKISFSVFRRSLLDIRLCRRHVQDSDFYFYSCPHRVVNYILVY